MREKQEAIWGTCKTCGGEIRFLSYGRWVNGRYVTLNTWWSHIVGPLDGHEAEML